MRFLSILYYHLIVVVVYLSDTTTGEKAKRKRKRKNSGSNSKLTRYDKAREQRFIAEEEKTIKRYEKLLKLKSFTKRNKLPKSFYYDGLGELLEICDNKRYANRVAVDDEDAAVDPFDELRNRTKKPKVQKKESKVQSEDDDKFSDDSEFGDEEMDDNSDDDG